MAHIVFVMKVNVYWIVTYMYSMHKCSSCTSTLKFSKFALIMLSRIIVKSFSHSGFVCVCV